MRFHCESQLPLTQEYLKFPKWRIFQAKTWGIYMGALRMASTFVTGPEVCEYCEYYNMQQ